ncbi:MAG: hypothetical protein ACLGIO_06565, partial [Acidimicrobiia bacterium]
PDPFPPRAKELTMSELDALYLSWSYLRARLRAAAGDHRGISTLEAVLWIAGLGTMAIGTLVVINRLLGDAIGNIPTGRATS